MTTTTTRATKREREEKLLPKHEQYLDAFKRYLFLKPEHVRHPFGADLVERTLRYDLKKLMTAGYLTRSRNNKDEEYTYFPADIREKSPLTLYHSNEITGRWGGPLG